MIISEGCSANSLVDFSVNALCISGVGTDSVYFSIQKSEQSHRQAHSIVREKRYLVRSEDMKSAETTELHVWARIDKNSSGTPKVSCDYIVAALRNN